MTTGQPPDVHIERPTDPPTSQRILVIDNYDSFVYNIVQYLGEFVSEIRVERNDRIDVDDIRKAEPDGIVISPGPGTPAQAGISEAIFSDLRYPTLGVCLGHQALCSAHGARVTQAPAIVHGKSSEIHHDGRGLFEGLPDPLGVGRYHSLAVGPETLPACLETAATSTADDPVIMAVRHRDRPHVGVQFHPESVLTQYGRRLVYNFLTNVCDDD